MFAMVLLGSEKDKLLCVSYQPPNFVLDLNLKAGNKKTLSFPVVTLPYPPSYQENFSEDMKKQVLHSSGKFAVRILLSIFVQFQLDTTQESISHYFFYSVL